jgi:hypothetical protein
MPTKTQLNIRISSLTRQQLADLVSTWGMTESEIISTLLDRETQTMTANQTHDLTIKYSESAIFGSTDPNAEGIDARATMNAYEAEVSKALKRVYPKARIEFERGINSGIETYDDPYFDLDVIRDIDGQVYEGWEFLRMK